MELRDYIDYIKYERKLSLETVKNYKYDLEKFLLFLKEKGIFDINLVTTKDIEDYLATLKNLVQKLFHEILLQSIILCFFY